MLTTKPLSFVSVVLIIASLLLLSLNPLIDNEDKQSEDNIGLLHLDRSKLSLKNSNDWSASGSAANPAVLRSVDTSPSNEIVVSGVISGSTTMTLGSTSITSGQYIEPWIAKADANGNWQWIQKVSITGSSQYAEATVQDISVAPNGDIFATGMFYDTISFGSITLTSTGYWDCWTAKLSSSGQWQWAQALRGNGDYDGVTVTTLDVVYGTSITTDSNSNPVVGGWFLGNTDVGVAADTGAQDGTDIEVFVAKYGNSGNLQWTEVARGQGSQEINTMTVDNNNDIWVATTFEVSMTFGSVVANAGINEIPMGIARISQSGTWQSAYATTGSGQPLATDFTMDDQNNLLMSGFYTGSINLGSQLTSSGQNDAFIASMNPSGSWNWAESVGGSSYDAGSGVEYDSNTGYAILGLYSQSSFNFGSQTFNTRGFNDSVVVTFTSNGNPVALFDAGSSLDDAITGISLMPNGALVVAGNYNGTIDFGSSSAASQSTSVLIPYVWVTETIAVLDADGDGVADDDDNCPNTANPGQENTDQDSEGDACDSDDDNDGITDNFPDNCPRNSQTGWTSTRDFADPASSTDWDNDGCKDDHPEDPDDDNDGVLDVNDNCPRTSYNPPRPTWVSDTTTDMDGDGCRDSDEDINDDGDGFDDSFDDCPTYYGTSTLGEQGCADSDGDGWSDETDTCPLQFGNSSANDKIGCLDSDGDGWADVDDAFDFEPTQWSDSDGDGFGDNPDGVNADDCIDVSGDSIFDRQGCYDFDEDGYSNPDGVWDEDNGADAFPQNPYQWSDFDGDGLGDNWGNSTWLDRPQTWPGEYVEFINQNEQDACPFQAGTSNQQGIYGCPDFDGDGWSDGLDVFVQEASQWLDSDGDGFGDNLDGFNGDYCPNVPGDSNQDRKGCIDTDGDGYSNIDEFWTRYSGGDVYPQDPTQWADSDGDGYGDNPGTVISDDCVEIAGDSTIDRMGCPDFDSDGYSDPTANWNTSSGADACSTVIGNSTQDRFGCFDSDGDGYSNKDSNWGYSDGADGYPDDPLRWGPPPSSEGASFATISIAGGGILILVIIGALLFVRNRRSSEQYTNANLNYQSINMPNSQLQQQVPQQNFPGNQIVQGYTQQSAQPDPAREYYQSLVNQGYPHEHAVAYTQQYFPGFVGQDQVNTSSSLSCSAAIRNSMAILRPLDIGILQVALP